MLITLPSCWDSLQPVGWVERQRNPSSFAKTRTLSQIGREEKAAAADKVSPIVRHRASIAEGDGFRGACHRAGPGSPSRSRDEAAPLRAGPVGSTHPTGQGTLQAKALYKL